MTNKQNKEITTYSKNGIKKYRHTDRDRKKEQHNNIQNERRKGITKGDTHRHTETNKSIKKERANARNTHRNT